MLHLFNLKVLFKDGLQWNLYIIAEDITWLSCWYSDRPKGSTPVNVEMKMLLENVTHGAGAKGITDEQAKIYLADSK